MSDEKQSPLRARLESHRQEMLLKEQMARRAEMERQGIKPGTGPLVDPGTDSKPGTGPLRPLSHRSPYAVSQIIDAFLPRTRRLTVLLTDKTLVLTDIEGFNPSRFEISFGRVNTIINELETQYRINNQADHPRLVDAANTMLENKIVAARFLLELFGHLKHSGGDNYQTWQLWENIHKNAATVILAQYLQRFEDVLNARLPDEKRQAAGQALSAFLTYVSPTSFLGSQHPRYYAIQRLVGKAVELSEISRPQIDRPPDPDGF